MEIYVAKWVVVIVAQVLIVFGAAVADALKNALDREILLVLVVGGAIWIAPVVFAGLLAAC